jgi:protein-S-isoprenylcysteine O-methyltransferase Ste14
MGLPGARVVAGVLLQALSLAVVVAAARYPLTPPPAALAGTLILAPASASLFVWTQIVSFQQRTAQLITWGPFARLRHPAYASLLGMLVSTALLAWPPWHFLVGVALYLVGSELRIGCEEEELADRFGQQFSEWTRRVRWRYLPGLR